MKMYTAPESTENTVPQHHAVQVTEKEEDGSWVLVIGTSHEPPQANRLKPPLIFVPGSCDWALYFQTLPTVQEMLKNLFDVLSIFHKHLSVLKQNLPFVFSSVFCGGDKKAHNPVSSISSRFIEFVLNVTIFVSVLLFLLRIRFLTKVPAVFSRPFSMVLQ